MIIKLIVKLNFLVSLVFLLTLPAACHNLNDRMSKTEYEITSETASPVSNLVMPEKKLEMITFFIENSGSMFGYVRGNTEFVSVLTELAQKPDLVRLNTNFDYMFINGRAPTVTPIGNTANLLTSRLNPAGFQVGDFGNSNLNAMFEVALANAGGNNVSILISDCIYAVGGLTNPLSAIINEGRGLRSIFIHRLEQENIQALVVQLSSRYQGRYFPGMGGVINNLDQQRPYYVWIFGDSDLLNHHFPESYFSSLPGYNNLARFFKTDEFNTSFEVVSFNDVGRYRQDRNDPNTIHSVRLDRLTNEFQFSIAIDFKSIPYPESYLLDKTNYICSDNYQIISISPATELSALIINALPFEPTHVITVKAEASPIGTLRVALKYVFPRWIEESTTDNDRHSPVDTNTTFGLHQLMQSIKEAYMEHSSSEILAPFIINIQN